METASSYIKQYGLKSSLKRAFLRILNPIIAVKVDIVLAISSHKTNSNLNKEVKVINMSNLQYWRNNRMINEKTAHRFESFLSNNCIGYYIEENHVLCAWGFIQIRGEYQYGSSNIYEIPKDSCVLKNLFVKPEFRGKNYGKLINQARLNAVPDNCLPIVFVIPENRFALRNLKILGFEEYLLVKHFLWFKHWCRRKIKILRPGEISDKLIEGFNE
ncbi:MAG TPA: GNAT family N-acetyltransferase [Bacteroidales bacterium]|jgi:GNAT superfamily N-acetyltransferase|nr:GNAT family N-acetyltransferase [Bacteroidales bacterium]